MCVSATRETSRVKFLNRQYKYADKQRGSTGFVFMCNFVLVKPGLHIVVTNIKHACNPVLKAGANKETSLWKQKCVHDTKNV